MFQNKREDIEAALEILGASAPHPGRHLSDLEYDQQATIINVMCKVDADKSAKRNLAPFDEMMTKFLRELPPGSGPRAAIFEDKGCYRASTRGLVEACEKAGFPQVSMVTGDEVAAGALAAFDILLVPGGDHDGMMGSLGPRGHSEVREFVRAGGGYFGVCGGTFLAEWLCMAAIYNIGTNKGPGIHMTEVCTELPALRDMLDGTFRMEGAGPPPRGPAAGPEGGGAGAAGEGNFSKWKVAELREALAAQGLPVTGTKPELVARMEKASGCRPPTPPTGGSAPAPTSKALEPRGKWVFDNGPIIVPMPADGLPHPIPLTLFEVDLAQSVVQHDERRFRADGGWACWSCFFENPAGTGINCSAADCRAVRDRPGVKHLPVGIMPGMCAGVATTFGAGRLVLFATHPETGKPEVVEAAARWACAARPSELTYGVPPDETKYAGKPTRDTYYGYPVYADAPLCRKEQADMKLREMDVAAAVDAWRETSRGWGRQ